MSSNQRTWWRGLSVGVALALLAFPGSHRAQADESEGVTIEASGPEDLALHLVAADGGRFTYLNGEGDLLLASPGQPPVPVARVEAPDPLAYGERQLFDLKGNTLRWAMIGPDGSLLHTLDLSKTEPVVQKTTETLLNWTPGGWIGFGAGVLTQHEASGSYRIRGPGLPDVFESQPRAVSDGTRTLVAFGEAHLEAGVLAGIRQQVLLLEDHGASVRSLFDQETSVLGPAVTNVLLTPESEVWSLNGGIMPQAGVVHRRSSSTGTVT